MTVPSLSSYVSSPTSININSPTSASLLPTSSFNHIINMKLTRDNYLLWKAQFLPYLCSQQLLGYVEGTIQCPSTTITQAGDGETAIVPNQEHHIWFQQVQLVLCALLSSLTEEVLSHVVFLSTSREVWLALEKILSSSSRAWIMQIRM